jgi:hypothetical protein
MEIMNALLRGTIDLRRGELILRALNTAVRNIRRVRFGGASGMVTQIPDYSEDEEPADAERKPVTPATRAATTTEEPDCEKPNAEAAAQVKIKIPTLSQRTG